MHTSHAHVFIRSTCQLQYVSEDILMSLLGTDLWWVICCRINSSICADFYFLCFSSPVFQIILSTLQTYRLLWVIGRGCIGWVRFKEGRLFIKECTLRRWQLFRWLVGLCNPRGPGGFFVSWGFLSFIALCVTAFSSWHPWLKHSEQKSVEFRCVRLNRKEEKLGRFQWVGGNLPLNETILDSFYFPFMACMAWFF